MTEEAGEPLVPAENYSKVIVIALIAVGILTAITIGAYQYAKKRSGVVVLPGGTTYLGPSTAPTQPPQPQNPGKFTADETVEWVEFKGKNQPFSFSYPKTLQLTTFPNDITESIGIGWNNVPPQNNIFFRISDINKVEPNMAKYINQPKIEYVKHWWEQYTGGLKGVKTVTAFTNSKGMVGYKAKYLNHADQTPNDDVFFEVPGRKDLMVRFGNGVLDGAVFDKIIDSFFWGTAVKPSTAQPTTTP
jgi:hypothetical protein